MRAAPADRQTVAARRLAGWLAMLPFLLFSLVLPGTMLARDASGGMTVVLCSGDGLVEMAVAADGSLVPVEKTRHDERQVCDWTPHGQSLAETVGPAPLPPLPMARRLVLSPARTGHLHRAEILAAPARGPPAPA